MAVSLTFVLSFCCHSNPLRMVAVLITRPRSLILLTRFLIGVAAGALGEKFSACPAITCDVAATTARATETGAPTD